MRLNVLSFLFVGLFLTTVLKSQTIVTVGRTGADYNQLALAFDAINSGSITGDIIIKVIANTEEKKFATLLGSGNGNSSYSSVLIFPTDTVSIINKTFTYGSLIDLRGADNVTIDGRINQQGTFQALKLSNEWVSKSNSYSLISFSESAENNIVKYCEIAGSCRVTNSGLITFRGANTGNGNNNNTVSNCNIRSNYYTAAYAIYAYSDSIFDKNNIIENNAISNIWNEGESYDIKIDGLSKDWIIRDNSFFHTYDIKETINGFHGIMQFNQSKKSPAFGPSGLVINNKIGGSKPNCEGTPWKLYSSEQVALIDINCGNTQPIIFKNNTIRNFNAESYLAFKAINIKPLAKTNIIDNIIGDTLYHDSINVKGELVCINNSSNDSVLISGNYISSVSCSRRFTGILSKTSNNKLVKISDNHIGSHAIKNSINARTGAGIQIENKGLLNSCRVENNTVESVKTIDYFSGIYITYSNSDDNNKAYITGNIIGDTVGTNSIVALSGISGIDNESMDSVAIIGNKVGSLNGVGPVAGIYSPYFTKKTVIKNNFIGSHTTPASLTSIYYDNSDYNVVTGIHCEGKGGTIENNVINHIATNARRTKNDGTDFIVLVGIDARSAIVNKNVVCNLLSTNPDTSSGGGIIGIRSDTASSNFVFNFKSISNRFGFEGIDNNMYTGFAFNNIVSLGFGDTNKSGIDGIISYVAYNNTVIIGGTTVPYGESGSRCLSAKKVLNNLLVNLRKGGKGNHSLIYVQSISDYNQFYFSDTVKGAIGNSSGFYTTLSAWQSQMHLDYKSFFEDPKLIPGDSVPAGFKPVIAKLGTGIPQVTSDFYGNPRPSPPTIGAIEGATQTLTKTITACKKYALNGKTYTKSGTYRQNTINSNGVIVLLTLNLTITHPDTSVTSDGSTLTANLTGATYQWIDCKTKSYITGATQQSYIPAVTGNYAVIVTKDSTVCTDTSGFHYIKVIPTELKQTGDTYQLFIYPNPASDKLLIETEHPTTISITDLVGQELIQYFIQSQQTISVSDLIPGVYLIKDLKSNQIIKFIKL